MESNSDRRGIAFLDVETTFPSESCPGRAIYEIGVILVCPQRLSVLHIYSTLVRPAVRYLDSFPRVMRNGITPDDLASAPTFPQIAHQIYDLLHGRIWAGHNIVKWDCVRIREAFAEIGRQAPEPMRTIDSLELLTQKFGRRAGNMKLATLANYFDLGQQAHRSVDDVRLNIEVLKNCSMVLFLESSLNASPVGTNQNMNTLTSENESRNHQRAEILDPVEANIAQLAPSEIGPLIDIEQLETVTTMEERHVPESLETSSNAAVQEGSSGCAGFLEPEEVSIPLIGASLVPSYPGRQKIQLVHKDVPLQLYCSRLRVHFGPSSKFLDRAGRPQLSIVVDPSPSLCEVLDVCDNFVKLLSVDQFGSSSEYWSPVVTRNNRFTNSSTIRLHIPALTNGDTAIYATEIYQKDNSGNAHIFVFNMFNVAELDSLFVPGTLVDAYFSLDVYNYPRYAGIRLVAKKLIIHANYGGNALVMKKAGVLFIMAEPSNRLRVTEKWLICTNTEIESDTTMEERHVPESLETSSNATVQEGSSGYAGFLEPEEVSIPFISASLVPSYPGRQKIQLVHKDVPLQLYCSKLRVHFGPISKFLDRDGRPQLSIVVDPSPSLCEVLDVCDNFVKLISVDQFGSSSEYWWPVVTRNNRFTNSSTIRLHIPALTNEDTAIYATEIYQKDASGNAHMFVFNRFDATELDSLFVSGVTLVDACFSLDVYNYPQYSGIQLVAKKLIIHAN
ncbi:hypothetical protein HHK36_033326 [Tetracentron sinense]|uniref:Exonuclease domain-containing protein n=1 Tax=Tetracentron sinense TaxID=13715 RepID=A0A834Y7S8_TETSI|nr:hypothetical protein HHK36_033326 [Tetracentron sinense]